MTKSYRRENGARHSAHNYLAGIAESDTTLSSVTGGGIARWEAVADGMATTLVADVGDTDWEVATPAMYRRIVPTPASPPLVTSTSLISVTFDTVLSTQRRRKYGRGA